MSTLGRTWQLFKQSFSVLSEEPSLVVFPMFSAVSALLLITLFFVPLNRLYAGAAKGNIASTRHLEKCGFALCGSAKAFAKAHGTEIEEVFFELD